MDNSSQSSSEWFRDPKYDFYWNSLSKTNTSYLRCFENYSKTFSAIKLATCAAHEATCKQLSDLNCPMPVFMGGSQELVEPTTNQSVNKKQKKKKIRHRKKEDDIDEEYLRFFEEGLLFRKNHENKIVESEKSKLNKESIQDDSFIGNVMFMNQERENELKFLYGKQWQKILSMETDLQITHDRNIDLYQPKYWPNFPLRIKF